MVIRTTGYWDETDPYVSEEFEKKWAYGASTPKVDKDFVFNPLYPPRNCTPYHPPLKLTINDLNTEIYGSSCLMPNINDADVYVSFDSMAKTFEWEQPWENSPKKHIRFFIKDGSVPENQKQFDACLDYVIKQLEEGKKVHAGCIGGHGRTGVFLAAIAQKTMGKNLDHDKVSAIDYVRDNYCNNAVETFKQVLYLYGVYDIAPPMSQEKTIMEFADKFKQEMGVSFRDVMKNTDYHKMQPAISEIQKLISVSYINNYSLPRTVPYVSNDKPRRELTLEQQDLEDLAYEKELKAYELETKSNSALLNNNSIDTKLYIKNMGFDFTSESPTEEIVLEKTVKLATKIK
jgi:protein-tyrosine phosphatase